MKRWKCLGTIVASLILLLGFGSTNVGAIDISLEHWANLNSRYDYVITDYDIDITISQDNRYHISEKLDVRFNDTTKHGIFRDIPYRSTMHRVDGSSDVLNAYISDISVQGSDYSIGREDGNVRIKLGDKNETIGDQPERHYEINYVYDYGADKLSGADEVYHNIVGTEWQAPIYHVDFRIELPKDFAVGEDNPGFSLGRYGLIGMHEDQVEHQVDGRVISGQTLTPLDAYEGLTMRLTLPDGYFVVDRSIRDYIMILPIIVSLAGVIVAFRLWRKHGRDSLVTTVVQYEPPQGLNSLETALVYKGSVSSADTVSLLIYLANKGYIKIHTDDKKWRKYQIIKLKDYDGSNSAEASFMRGLFKGGRTEVSNKELTDKFYITAGSIAKKMNAGSLAKDLFIDNLKQRKSIMVMIAAALVSLAVAMIVNGRPSDLVVSVIISVCAIAVICAIACATKRSYRAWLCNLTGTIVALGIWSLFAYAAFGGSEGGFSNNYLVMGVYTITSIMICIQVVLCSLIGKLSANGTKLLGEVRGYKDFIETVDKPRIEAMVNDNPQFFYDVLPYAYALDVTKVWVDKFKDITIEQPGWYDSSIPFSYRMMYSFTTVGVSKMSSAMTSTPSSSGSGGGGGFSGGGGGGGGGGSW